MTRLPARKLYRSEEGVVAGVAAGLSAYLKLPVVLTRILFIILFFAGPGLPLYVLFWLLTPRDPASGYISRGGLSLPFIFFIGILLTVGIGISLAAAHIPPFGVFLFLISFIVGLIKLAHNRKEEEGEGDEITPVESFHQEKAHHYQPTMTVKIDSGKKIAGVCAWFAAKTNMDVTLVRVLAVVLSFFTFPLVPVLYLVAAFIIPKQEKLQVR